MVDFVLKRIASLIVIHILENLVEDVVLNTDKIASLVNQGIQAVVVDWVNGHIVWARERGIMTDI